MRSSVPPATPFSLLPTARAPWREFVFSSGMQALAVALLIWMRFALPAVVSPPAQNSHLVVLVNTPPPVNHRPQPVVRIQAPLIASLDSSALRLPAPQPKRAAKAEEEAPPVNIAPKKVEPLPINSAPIIPKEAVRTNVFLAGSSATPTVARAPAQVQTGGFGDPNGIPAKVGQSKPANIAAVGSFDLPSRPGNGNGTGGAKGVAGVVASSGFGSGTAIADSRPRPQTTVQSTAFSSADVPASPTVRTRPAEAARSVPPEILTKPIPNYTQEARNLRIEGEVLLEVVLEASGSLRVVRVVRGLGHGLDDNAVQAAQQIHFKPAMKDGQPADSTVVLHIIFQLA